MDFDYFDCFVSFVDLIAGSAFLNLSLFQSALSDKLVAEIRPIAVDPCLIFTRWGKNKPTPGYT